MPNGTKPTTPGLAIPNPTTPIGEYLAIKIAEIGESIEMPRELMTTALEHSDFATGMVKDTSESVFAQAAIPADMAGVNAAMLVGVAGGVADGTGAAYRLLFADQNTRTVAGTLLDIKSVLHGATAATAGVLRTGQTFATPTTHFAHVAESALPGIGVGLSFVSLMEGIQYAFQRMKRDKASLVFLKLITSIQENPDGLTPKNFQSESAWKESLLTSGDMAPILWFNFKYRNSALAKVRLHFEKLGPAFLGVVAAVAGVVFLATQVASAGTVNIAIAIVAGVAGVAYVVYRSYKYWASVVAFENYLKKTLEESPTKTFSPQMTFDLKCLKFCLGTLHYVMGKLPSMIGGSLGGGATLGDWFRYKLAHRLWTAYRQGLLSVDPDAYGAIAGTVTLGGSTRPSLSGLPQSKADDPLFKKSRIDLADYADRQAKAQATQAMQAQGQRTGAWNPGVMLGSREQQYKAEYDKVYQSIIFNDMKEQYLMNALWLIIKADKKDESEEALNRLAELNNLESWVQGNLTSNPKDLDRGSVRYIKTLIARRQGEEGKRNAINWLHWEGIKAFFSLLRVNA